MKKQTVYVVDAFTDRAFGGNQAAVCVYKKHDKFSDAVMQRMAAEMNLSETCFVFPIEDNLFSLRWFTPTTEVPLCGHATLAAAHVLFLRQKRAPKREKRHDVLRFRTQKGELTVRKHPQLKGQLLMDFPAGKPEKVGQMPQNVLQSLAKALSIEERHVQEMRQCNVTRKLLVIVDSPQDILKAKPDAAAIQAIEFPPEWTVKGVILTSKSEAGSKYDVVSRYFAPFLGILEDPVTGSAHCALAPYWCEQLGRKDFLGFQASSRGGLIGVELNGDRVFLSGEAVVVLKGKMKF